MNYYNEKANEFIEDTFNSDMSVQYAFFEQHLPGKATTILDLGFGSGRDSLYFSKKYEVYAIDRSEVFCQKANELGLKNVFCMTAQEMKFINKFDGIWACASLLHVKKEELNLCFNNCAKASKDDGVLYCSFKYGDFEGDRNGRYFTDLTEATIKEYLKDTNLKIIESLITNDVRPNRSEKWLNVILKR